MLGPLILLEKNPACLMPFLFQPLFIRSQNPNIMEEPNPLHCLFQIHCPHFTIHKRGRSLSLDLPSQVHKKPQSLHQQHVRSSVPAREKSFLSYAIPFPATVRKKSESPHHGRAKPTTLPVPNTLSSLHHPQERQKYRPRSPSRSKKTPTVLSDVSTPVSPFGSPPPPNPTTPGNASRLQGLLRSRKRHRTSSSSSKLVLVPVVKKLDEIAGYENIIHDSKMGIKVPNRVPDIIPTIRDRNKKDGTNVAVSVSEDHHKSEKKKRKKEHKEHKRKDNYRNREERKHKHIHKDKDKDGHKGEKAESSAPIKITVPKDNISLGSTLEAVAGTGPTIKNQRRRPIICTDSTVMYTYSGPSGELKMKIGKEVISNFSNSMTGSSGSNSETPSSSRKRDRSSPQSSELVPPLGPPAKAAQIGRASCRERV